MSLDEGYRRGTVLGLTIAEVFVLLVFLMLLALMGLNRHYLEDTVQTRSGEKDKWEQIVRENTADEVRTALLHPDELEEEVGRLQRQIASLQEARDRLQRRVRILQDREGTTGEALDDTLDLVKKLKDENEELTAKVGDLTAENRWMTKGTNPPCWYQVIEETDPTTDATVREKAYYLFDVAIRDDLVEVQPLPPPPGRAADDDGRPYFEEAHDLRLDDLPYGEVTDQEFRRAMTPLFRQAREQRIRSYACIFWVRVWDETSPDAKGRWQEAHDGLLEGLFGTHRVTDRPWRERHLVPVNVPAPSLEALR